MSSEGSRSQSDLAPKRLSAIKAYAKLLELNSSSGTLAKIFVLQSPLSEGVSDRKAVEAVRLDRKTTIDMLH